MVEMEVLLEHFAHEGLHPETTVTRSFSLPDTKRAYDLFDGGTTGRVVITWS